MLKMGILYKTFNLFIHSLLGCKEVVGTGDDTTPFCIYIVSFIIVVNISSVCSLNESVEYRLHVLASILCDCAILISRKIKFLPIDQTLPF